MTLKLTHKRYPENDKGCLSGPKKRVVQTGNTFTPLYNGIEDSYGVDSIGYYWVIGVLEGHTTLAEDANFSSNTHSLIGIHTILLRACMEGRSCGRTIQSLIVINRKIYLYIFEN